MPAHRPEGAVSAFAEACDCHVHVFDPGRFPYAADRSYTPGRATVEGLKRFRGAVGTGRLAP